MPRLTVSLSIVLLNIVHILSLTPWRCHTAPLYPPERGKALCHIPHSPLVLLESFNSEVLHGQDGVGQLALKIMSSIKKAELHPNISQCAVLYINEALRYLNLKERSFIRTGHVIR